MSVETQTSSTSNKKSANVGKQFGLVALLTIISKLAGFARDVLVAKAYGTKVVADAYNFAYQFTGSILILFGGLGGPFHSTTLSLLTSEKEDPEKAGLLVTQVFFWTGLILGVLSLLLFLVAPHIVHFWHYTPPLDPVSRNYFETELCMQLQWMSPMILISGLIGISYGVLNAYGKIFWPSISPMIASTSIIIGLLIYHQHPGEQLTARPLAIASMIGAFGQMIAQLPDLMRCNLKWRLVIKPSPLVIEYLKMLLPACFATLIGTLMTYVDMFFAGNTGTGGWTAVTNSNRLVQLPLGILATAMLVPMLPRFTERAKEQDSEAVKTDYKKALQFMIFLSMPITAILLCIPEPVIRLLFKRGAFDEASVHLVAFALVWLAPQIVFYLGRDLITRVYFAYKDTNTPGKVALVAIAVKAVLDWLFVIKLPLGVAGISLASTLITIMNLSLLHHFLRKKIGSLKSTTMVKPLAIITAAGIACGALTFAAYRGWEHYASFALPNLSWERYAGITLPQLSSMQVEKAHMVPVKPAAPTLVDTSATPPETTASTGPAWFYESWIPTPKIVTSAATPEIKFESSECLISMILGIGLSCSTGLLAYLAVCVFGRLEEINMLVKRLPGASRRA